jgi:protein translocase SecG subunit
LQADFFPLGVSSIVISLPSFSFPLIAAAAPPAGVASPPAAALTPAPLPLNVQNFEFSALTKTPLAQNYPWVTHTFAGLFVITAILLVVLLAIQTTKQEGLSGTIGGRVESAYRPRLGFDQQLGRLTSYVAIAFVVLATIVSLSGI